MAKKINQRVFEELNAFPARVPAAISAIYLATALGFKMVEPDETEEGLGEFQIAAWIWLAEKAAQCFEKAGALDKDFVTYGDPETGTPDVFAYQGSILCYPKESWIAEATKEKPILVDRIFKLRSKASGNFAHWDCVAHELVMVELYYAPAN